ncbi:MAG: 50S ribosomal protein L4 [Bdellovibrionota bacterium]|nr:50S ribosomal protein L4 [Bdellovibrionota bacterium]MEC8623453.1 50S ribosomal protein L4 [Bdellovibrionota bacterium]|tara:strand:- start:49 stop:666 length:618 start_codon:yes stop_codon:yes gene_type:complete
MAEITVLDKNFNESDKLSLDIDLTAEKVNVPVVHQVVKATLAGRRQGTAKTKERGEIRGGGAKPFKQKGTGRARQGSSRSPLLVGGGTIFGPKPRSYAQKLNKKVVKTAINAVIADKFQAGKLTVLDKIESNGKTKDLHKELSERNLLPALLVVEQKDSLALRAVKNLKNGKGLSVEGFSVYEAVKFENLIIEKNALEKLSKRLG